MGSNQDSAKESINPSTELAYDDMRVCQEKRDRIKAGQLHFTPPSRRQRSQKSITQSAQKDYAI